MTWRLSCRNWRISASSASIDRPPGYLGSRLVQAEAALLLIAARLLIARVRFGRWRWLLGHAEQLAPPGLTHHGAPTVRDCHAARTVERVADRLPLDFKCLPRAMALHWMLWRRGRPCALTFAVLPGTARGTIDDLHAWVELNGAILIGASDAPYRPLARFAALRQCIEN